MTIAVDWDIKQLNKQPKTNKNKFKDMYPKTGVNMSVCVKEVGLYIKYNCFFLQENFQTSPGPNPMKK